MQGIKSVLINVTENKLDAKVNQNNQVTLNRKRHGRGHRERSQLRRSHQCLFPCKGIKSVLINVTKKTRGPKGHTSCTRVQCATFLMDWPGRPSCFSNQPEITNLVEDVEILLPVKFRWIPFSGSRAEVENVSANQRPGWPSCFSDRPEKHKLGRGPWDLASCQVSFNSAQRFQRRNRKCLSQSEARAAILFFRSDRKTQTWQRTLRSCFLSSFVEFRSAVSEEKSKMSQPIRGQGRHLVFPIGLKNTNFVEDLEILLPVKFHSILLSGFKGEIENI